MSLQKKLMKHKGRQQEKSRRTKNALILTESVTKWQKNPYLSIIPLSMNELSSSIKRHKVAELIKKIMRFNHILSTRDSRFMDIDKTYKI